MRELSTPCHSSTSRFGSPSLKCSLLITIPRLLLPPLLFSGRHRLPHPFAASAIFPSSLRGSPTLLLPPTTLPCASPISSSSLLGSPPPQLSLLAIPLLPKHCRHRGHSNWSGALRNTDNSASKATVQSRSNINIDSSPQRHPYRASARIPTDQV